MKRNTKQILKIQAILLLWLMEKSDPVPNFEKGWIVLNNN